MIKHALYPSKQSIIFPADAELPSEIPTRTFEYRGRTLKACQDNLKNYYALKPLVPELECPIYRHYEFPCVDSDPKKPAMQHQKDGAAFMVDYHRSWNVSEMGTGKTVTVLYGTDYLIKEGLVKKVLIFSPLSTLNRVWADSIFSSFLHTGYQWVVLHGTAKKRQELLQQNATFYIANHDFVKVCVDKHTDAHGNVSYTLNKDYLELKQFDLILFDESACLRNGDTFTYQGFKAILEPHQRLVLMTGTPTPTQATDVFWPSKLVNPSATPKFYGAFRRQVMYSIKIGPFEKWHNRDDSAPTVFAAMHPVFRVKKSEVLDLPPVVWEQREVELTKEQQQSFKTMLKDMTMTVGDKQIDAVNAAAKIGKLHQILCGAVKDGEDYVELDCKHRLQVVLECIEESLSKTIIVCPYKGIARYLHEQINKKLDNCCELINGDVSPADRDIVLKRFDEDKTLRVVVVHPKCMCHGLTMTSASTMIFYSAIRGNEIYRQVVERMARPGQKNKMTMVQLGGHVLEWKMYERLDSQEDFQQSVLKLYDDILKADNV